MKSSANFLSNLCVKLSSLRSGIPGPMASQQFESCLLRDSNQPFAKETGETEARVNIRLKMQQWSLRPRFVRKGRFCSGPVKKDVWHRIIELLLTLPVARLRLKNQPKLPITE